jgi:uncharacterized membrane protein (UPF0127 family)
MSLQISEIRQATTMIVINHTKGITIGTHITLANTSLTRLVGLAGRRRLDTGCGLLIKPSSGIHTFGMRFAIDVVALNKRLQVVKLWRRLPPFRVTSVSLRVHSVLEFPSGTIANCQIDIGDQLEII